MHSGEIKYLLVWKFEAFMNTWTSIRSPFKLPMDGSHTLWGPARKKNIGVEMTEYDQFENIFPIFTYE